MFQSIIDDIKSSFRMGNTLTKIIIVNVAIFAVVRLIVEFTGYMNPGGGLANHPLVSWLALSSDPITILKRPWTIFTSFFLHLGVWHVVWNMVLLYWFGRIIGDFLGDRRVLPIYILGGLIGGTLYVVADHLIPIGTDGNAVALGASAAVMAFVFAAAAKVPDYGIRLFLIPVTIKIKYIALVILFFDLIGTNGTNSGGHIAHLGGAAFGMVFIYYLNQGVDITGFLQKLFSGEWLSTTKSAPQKRKSPVKVVYRNEKMSRKNVVKEKPVDFQDRLDGILDKIKSEGYDNLTSEEKEFLYSASKKK